MVYQPIIQLLNQYIYSSYRLYLSIHLSIYLCMYVCMYVYNCMYLSSYLWIYVHLPTACILLSIYLYILIYLPIYLYQYHPSITHTLLSYHFIACVFRHLHVLHSNNSVLFKSALGNWAVRCCNGHLVSRLGANAQVVFKRKLDLLLNRRRIFKSKSQRGIGASTIQPFHCL